MYLRMQRFDYVATELERRLSYLLVGIGVPPGRAA
jgi:hypothetical protein